MNPIRARWRAWWQARLQPTDTLTLTQGNCYILPTRAGWMLALTLLVLLVASINFQLNLGYLLTFLLAGSAAAGMWVGHSTLRGTQLRLHPPEPPFAGQRAPLAVELTNPRRTPRHGLAVAAYEPQPRTGMDWAWTDVPAEGSATVHIAFHPARRGLHPVPMLTAQTLFPLGAFRVWTYWQPASRVLVYPAPETPCPPLPPGEPRAGGPAAARAASSSGEFEGVRAYRRGDPLKLVVWKKAAQSFAAGSHDLVSRDVQQAQRHELWLDVARCGLHDPEARIARAAAWVLQADRLGLAWGLRLPGGAEIAPDAGAQHKRRCLEALALC
ncbi:MAG: DUF58 domain-containing protein [Acidovorax sp.]